MTINTNQAGFDEAKLRTANFAEMYATWKDDYDYFYVSMSPNGVYGWYFMEEDCREAAEFFLLLADEANRRSVE